MAPVPRGAAVRPRLRHGDRGRPARHRRRRASGSIEVVSILTDKLDITWATLAWVGRIDRGTIGFWIVGLFVVTWVIALAVWMLGRVEQRWAPTGEPGEAHEGSADGA